VRALSTVYYFSLCYFALALWMGYAADWIGSCRPIRAFPSIQRPSGQRSTEKLAFLQRSHLAMDNIAYSIFFVLLPGYLLVHNFTPIDQSGNYEPRLNAQAVLKDHLAQNAVVVAPWEVITPMRYLQFVENLRPDLLLINVSPIWPQFSALHDKAAELGRAYYDVEFTPEFKKGNDFRFVQAAPLPLRDTPHPNYELQKNIVNEVQVIGYDLEPDPPIPGRAARVLVYYRTLARMFPMYSSVLSVSNILGVPIKDAPGFPASYYYPTYRWRTDEVYRDVYSFIVPANAATGLYSLDLSWFPYDLGTSSSDHSKESKLALGAIRVGDFNPPHQIAHPANARIGDAIAFLGWDSSSQSSEMLGAARGKLLPLELYWRAERTINESYTVFVHLVNAQGEVVADGDSMPFSGLYGTERWRVGESLRDQHAISIPATLAAGKYFVEIGIYLPTNGNRLPILTGADRSDKIILASVDVR
jgi:hypothetical protein